MDAYLTAEHQIEIKGTVSTSARVKENKIW
jgi:hypothetical protein